jgi:hypothetical protein
MDVLSRKEYTPDELSATYYNRSELRQMKETVRTEARLLQSGALTETPEFSIRGLECKTQEGLRRKRQNRMNANAAIFFELDGQDSDGIFDEERLADAYYVHSEPCQTSAHMVGVRDAILAKEASGSMKSYTVGTSFCKGIVDLSTLKHVASSAA